MEPTTTFEPTTTTPCPPDPKNPCPGDPNSVPKCKRLVNGMITSDINDQGEKSYYIVVQCLNIRVKDNIAALLESLRLALIALQEANKYKSELVQLNYRVANSVRTAPTSPSPGQPSVYYFQALRASNLVLIANAEANIESMELNISNIQNAIAAASYADWTPEMRQAFADDKTHTYKQNIDANLEGTIFRTVEPRIPGYLTGNESRTDR